MTFFSAPTSLSFVLHDLVPSEIYTLSLHDALPISARSYGLMISASRSSWDAPANRLRMRTPSSSSRTETNSLATTRTASRSEEHTSELQSPDHLVCRLLLEKKKKNKNTHNRIIM